jgi:hypothetical protein
MFPTSISQATSNIGADGKEYNRNRNPLEKYALFMPEEIETIRKYTNLETDRDRFRKVLSKRKDEKNLVLEALLEIEIKINELMEYD